MANPAQKKEKTPKIVVITGGSSGIGAQLVKRFAENGDRPVALCRSNPDRLSDFICCDLSDPENVRAAAGQITEKYGKVDILINNAGLGISGATELLPEEKIRHVAEVDYFAALLLTRAMLPIMRDGGKIVNISSACALFALPFRGVYCSAKAALNMFSFGLRMELAGTGIDVVCVCPGDIKSGFTENRLKTQDTNDRYGGRVLKAAQTIDAREDRRMSVVKCGRKIYGICAKKRKALYIVGGKYKLLNVAARILPTNLFLKLTNKLFGGY